MIEIKAKDEFTCDVIVEAVQFGDSTIGVATVYAHGHAQEEYYYTTYYQALQAHAAPDTYGGPEGIHHDDFVGIGEDQHGAFIVAKGPRFPKPPKQETDVEIEKVFRPS